MMVVHMARAQHVYACQLIRAHVASPTLNAQRGCWSLLLSLTPPTTLAAASTWLRMPSDAESVVVRHYFELRPPVQRHPTIPAKVARELRISVVAAAEVVVAAASRGLTSDALASSGEMARRLAAANSFARSLTVGNEAPDPTTAPPFFSLEPNTIGPPMRWAREAQGMGAADIAYGAGRFLLRPGETLLIRGKLPRCRFANVVLWNRFLQTFDYGDAGDADDQADATPVSLSRAQLHTVATATHGSASGEFTLVLSADSPFVDAAHERRVGANWLSTAGRVTGTVFFRFVLPDGEILQPRTQLLLEGEDVLGAIVGARAYACLEPGAGAANLAGGVAGWIHRAAGWVHRAADWMRARGRRLPTCATNET